MKQTALTLLLFAVVACPAMAQTFTTDIQGRPYPAPNALTATASTSSGSLGQGLRCYEVAAVANDVFQRQSTVSNESCATLTGAGHITINFTKPFSFADPTAYFVYRGTSAGGENEFYYVAVTGGPSVTSFVDDGTASFTPTTQVPLLSGGTTFSALGTGGQISFVQAHGSTLGIDDGTWLTSTGGVAAVNVNGPAIFNSIHGSDVGGFIPASMDNRQEIYDDAGALIGRVDKNANAFLKSVTVGTVSWTFGSGAPSGACVSGSIYSRTNAGATDPALYTCRNSAWVAGVPTS